MPTIEDIAKTIGSALGGTWEAIQKADWGTILPAVGLAYAGATIPGVAEGYNEWMEKQAKRREEEEKGRRELLETMLKAGYVPYEPRTYRTQTAEQYLGPTAGLARRVTTPEVETAKAVQAGKVGLRSATLPLPAELSIPAPKSVPMPALKAPVAETIPEGVIRFPVGDVGYWRQPTLQDLIRALSESGLLPKDAYIAALSAGRTPAVKVEGRTPAVKVEVPKREKPSGKGATLKPTDIPKAIAQLEDKRAEIIKQLTDPVASMGLTENDRKQLRASIDNIESQIERLKRLQGESVEEKKKFEW